MSIDQLQKEVTNIETQLTENIAEAEEQIIKIKSLFSEPAKLWIDRHTQMQIEKHSARVNEMEKKTLSELKMEISELKDQMEPLFDLAFSHKNLFPHNVFLEEDNDSPGREYHMYFDKLFRVTVSKLGTVLNKYGLLEVSYSGYSSWNNMGADRFEYSISLGLDTLPSFEQEGYWKTFQEINSIKTRLDSKKKELSASIAKDKWNTA